MSAWKNGVTALLSGLALVVVVTLPDHSGQRDFATTLASVPASKRAAAVAPSNQTKMDQLKDLLMLARGPVAGFLAKDLVSDQFLNHLVFDHLSSFEPLERLFQKGILSFEREALRTPQYHGEEGYDLVSYRIKHPLGGVSRVVAWRDSSEDGTIRIMVLSGQAGGLEADWSQFDNEVLSASSQMEWTNGERLLNHELTNASTLMRAAFP